MTKVERTHGDNAPAKPIPRTEEQKKSDAQAHRVLAASHMRSVGTTKSSNKGQIVMAVIALGVAAYFFFTR